MNTPGQEKVFVNPFPPHGVTVLEGQEFDKLLLSPSIDRHPIGATRAIVETYCNESRRNGRAVAIFGRPGAGKTHALLRSIGRHMYDARSGRGDSIVLYARSDGPDASLLYRKLMGQTSRESLSQLALRAFQFYARADSARTSYAGLEPLVVDPAEFEELLERGEVSWSGAVTRQEREFGLIRQSLEGFERAYRALLNPRLSSLAAEWIAGEKLSDLSLQKLGVDSNIETPESVSLALQVLCKFARRADCSLIIAIDQLDSLLIEGTGAPGNLPLLRSIQEACVSNAALLFVSGTLIAFDHLPLDIRERFGSFCFTIKDLRDEEAEDMLKAYCMDLGISGGSFPVPSLSFSGRAALSLNAAAVGNPRRLLQLARECIAMTTESSDRDGQISRDIAVAAVNRVASEIPDLDQLRTDLTELLLEDPGREFAWEGETVSVWLNGASPIAPALRIRLRNSILSADELPETNLTAAHRLGVTRECLIVRSIMTTVARRSLHAAGWRTVYLQEAGHDFQNAMKAVLLELPKSQNIVYPERALTSAEPVLSRGFHGPSAHRAEPWRNSGQRHFSAILPFFYALVGLATLFVAILQVAVFDSRWLTFGTVLGYSIWILSIKLRARAGRLLSIARMKPVQSSLHDAPARHARNLSPR